MNNFNLLNQYLVPGQKKIAGGCNFACPVASTQVQGIKGCGDNARKWS